MVLATAASTKPSETLDVENTMTVGVGPSLCSRLSASVILSEARRFCVSFAEEKRKQRRVVREHREASSSIDLSEQTNRSERTSSVSASSARSTSANTMSGWVVWEPFLPSSSSFCSA